MVQQLHYNGRVFIGIYLK